MATIKNEFDYIQEARSQLAEALINKFGVREQDILNADGSIKSSGLWASNSDGSKNYLKRLHDWAVLVTATNVHTDASLTFKNDGNGDAAGTTFNGSVARSISYNSIGAAPVGHTHTTKIETSTNTSQIALAYGGKYKLTAGGTTYVFTMPSSDNTWRPIGTGANDAAAGNHVHKNLTIKWSTGDTEGTNLFTYNGSTAKTIDLSTPFSQLFTNFGNADTGYKSTDITATIGGTTKSFAVNWAAYTGRAQIADKWTTARTLTIGSTGKAVNGSENVSWTLAEIGVSAAAHTHSVKINGATKTIAASNGAAVDLGNYLPLSGGTMSGNITINTDSEIRWSRNTDYSRIHFKNESDSDTNSYMGFETGDNGNGYFRFAGNSGGTITQWMSIKADGVRASAFIGNLKGNASTATKLESSAGNAALPIYFSDGKPVACVPSSLFSTLSNSGNNLSITIAGQNRTLTVNYANSAGTAATSTRRDFWINGYDGDEANTNCPVLVMHWPNRGWGDIWFDSSFHFGLHNSDNTYNNGADLHANAYYADSDIRYKNVIKHSCIDLLSLATLPLFLYTWNDKRDDIIHIGSSAQAVEQVIPQLVTEDSTGFKSLDYSILGTVVGITACKELVSQKSEIEMLKERVKQLEQQLKMYNG